MVLNTPEEYKNNDKNNNYFELARILRRILEIWGDLLSLRLQ